MTKHYLAIVVMILSFAALLRIVGLDKVPSHLSNDEISIAYDSYSIAHTLRDEHNHYLPVSFQSHNTYKAPLAIYLSAPLTLIVGNNEYSTRLPSAVLGVLTILFLGELVYELTKNKSLALFTYITLAITPWHIFSSRIAFEGNVALFCVVLGVFLFYKGLHKNSLLLTLGSFTSFALSIYGYHTEWVFTPLLIGTLLLLNRRRLPRKSIYVVGLVLFFVLLIPQINDILQTRNSSTRANTESFLNEPPLSSTLSDPSANLFHKSTAIGTTFINKYTEHLGLGYLFATGLNIPAPSNPLQPFQHGLFYIIFLPGFLVGFSQLKKHFGKNSLFIVAWAVISPLIPAMTKNGPHYIRNLVSLAPYAIIIALGNYVLWNYSKNRIYRSVYIFLIVISFVYFSLMYYVHYGIQSAENFQYGYKQVAEYINAHGQEYSHIIIDDKFGTYQPGGDLHRYDGVPHLYIPYYTNLDPQQFLNERQNLPEGVFFDKYQIKSINWNGEPLKPGYLYVTATSNLPQPEIQAKLREVSHVDLPDGNREFVLYTPN